MGVASPFSVPIDVTRPRWHAIKVFASFLASPCEKCLAVLKEVDEARALDWLCRRYRQTYGKDRKNRHYLALLVHYLNGKWERRKVLLYLEKRGVSNTSANEATKIKAVQEENIKFAWIYECGTVEQTQLALLRTYLVTALARRFVLGAYVSFCSQN